MVRAGERLAMVFIGYEGV